MASIILILPHPLLYAFGLRLIRSAHFTCWNVNNTNLRINKILAESVIRVLGHGSAESEEDICRHGVDPELEIEENIQVQL